MANPLNEFPKTLFIIPDGNRRHAKINGKLPWEGHQAGYENFKHIFDAVWDYDVMHFAFFGLSEDNLRKRSETEIFSLFRLLERALREVEEKLAQDRRQIRFHAAGDWKRKFPTKLCNQIQSLEKSTCRFGNYHFTLLLAYDGRSEWEGAIGKAHMMTPQYSPLSLNATRRYLYSSHIPDIDLCIRTGIEGDSHLSGGALMLQMANAQFEFTKTLWPDFTVEEFDKIMLDYKNRERRLGS